MPRNKKTTKSPPDTTDFEAPALAMTEHVVRRARDLIRRGVIEPSDGYGRRSWRDTGSRGLVLTVNGRTGSASWDFVGKVGGRAKRKRIGDVDALTLAEARASVGRLRYDKSAVAVLAPRERARGSGARIGEVFTAYIEAAEAGTFKLGRRREPITDRTVKNYRDVFKATLKTHEGQSLDWLAENIVRLHRELGLPSGSGNTKKPGRPFQANRMLQTARNIFTFAASTGTWTKPNPCVDPATGGIIAKFPEHSRDRILSDAEERRLDDALAKEGDPWRDLFAIASLTGRRMSAVCSMRWADVDEGRRVWTVPRNEMKGRKSAHGLKLDPEVAAILKRRRGQAVGGAEWVFPAPRSPGPVKVWKTAWDRIRKATGLDSTNKAHRVRPHDLRRSWGARLTEAGAPMPVVNHALGNSPNSIAMTAKVYMQITDAAQEEAIMRTHARRQVRKAAAAKRSRPRRSVSRGRSQRR